jgi:hypothetical protein
VAAAPLSGGGTETTYADARPSCSVVAGITVDDGAAPVFTSRSVSLISRS